eukprot:771296-Heterocapsa_arctica.AAC.1
MCVYVYVCPWPFWLKLLGLNILGHETPSPALLDCASAVQAMAGAEARWRLAALLGFAGRRAWRRSKLDPCDQPALLHV